MAKYLPFIVVLPFVAGLTAVQWRWMDWVWGNNLPAMQCAYLLQTEIPKEFGDWVGVDRQVDERIRKTAGADGYIDRVYTNTKTNEQVSIWFIVGHFRQVSRHTPNVCYLNAGFEQVEKQTGIPIEVPDLPTADFWTAKFMREQGGQEYYQRVFWAWWRPDPIPEGKSPEDINIVWSNPEDPRVKFGYCRALYKLYFTAGTNAEGVADQSVCIKFAHEFLPIVDEKIRESGVVMVQEELPEDHEEIFAIMNSANEGSDQSPAKEEEETEATDEATSN